MSDTLKNFDMNGISLPVNSVESYEVKAGVTCETYTFKSDNTMDLAIVTVDPGFSTPKQRILDGELTIEVMLVAKVFYALKLMIVLKNIFFRMTKTLAK